MRIHALRPLTTVRLAVVASALMGLLLPTSVMAADARPAKKDSNPRLRPKEATLTPSVTPTEAKAGDTVTFQVKVALEPGWHIYTYAKVQTGEGPRNTTLDLFDTGGLKPVGDWTASKPAIRKKEEAFPDIPFLEFYEDEVTWSLKLQVPPDLEPGKKTLRCQVGFQLCDAKSCKIPGQWSVPPVELTVLPGGAKAAAVTTPPPAPKAEPPAASPAITAPEPAIVPVNEAQRKAEQGILGFLLFAAGGGLIALAMPCVWPMVPITVNFFVKQGQAKKGSTTGLAVAYCLAIIGIFTSFGVLCSFFFSATALQRLANNPWLNIAVAGLFVAFGLSLLGMFEIRLPSFLLNASAKGEGRGGLVGVMFMALTLTITSFTCTFPVVGALIVMAAGGEFFYPIVGLATFATVLALPFFLLALSPGLLSKMPRGGDWMNAVKVIGGLVEIGAAFKFLNTAELAYTTPENAWIDAELVLTVWVVLALVCGIYLLGLFRTDHDQGEVRVGPGRLVLGSIFLGLALYMAPALFGRPPQSMVWDRLIVGILPPDAGELTASTGLAGTKSGGDEHVVKATSSDPEVALRQAKSRHGVLWGMSYPAAQERSKAEGRPILIDFTGVNCANCRLMEKRVMPRPEVVKLLNQFVTVQLYTDFVPISTITADQRQELAEVNQNLLIELAREATNPFYVVISPEGAVLETIGGYREPEVFVGFLNNALGKLQNGKKVAKAG